MKQWVSFEQLKAAVSIYDVLRHYGWEETGRQKRGDELVGLCMFHTEGRGSFHASISKNCWRCFSCSRQGNVLDFVAQMEGDISIRQAALLVAEWFQITAEKAPEGPHRASAPHRGISAPVVGQENKPLTFTLKLDPEHPYLKNRGLKQQTINLFGLGYCARGLFRGRIAIPIQDAHGELVAYAGRWPGEPPEGEEKYKVPAGFVKSAVVFNLHRQEQAEEGAKPLAVCEGFFDCMKISQADYPAVSIMGSSLSEQQAQLLVNAVGPKGRIVLLMDGDEAGRNSTVRCLEMLQRRMFVKAIELEEGSQPDQLTEQQIHELLAL